MRFPTFILSVAFATAAFAAPLTHQTIDFTNKSIASGTGAAGGGAVIISNTQNPDDAKDESTLITYCDSGYTLSGTGTNAQCISTKSVIYSCNGGVKPVGNMCPTPEHQCRYNSNNMVSDKWGTGHCHSNGVFYTWDGKRVSKGKYTKGKMIRSYGGGGCKGSFRNTFYEICGEALVNKPANESCPSGYNKEGDKCRKYRLPKYKSSN